MDAPLHYKCYIHGEKKFNFIYLIYIHMYFYMEIKKMTVSLLICIMCFFSNRCCHLFLLFNCYFAIYIYIRSKIEGNVSWLSYCVNAWTCGHKVNQLQRTPPCPSVYAVKVYLSELVKSTEVILPHLRFYRFFLV